MTTTTEESPPKRTPSKVEQGVRSIALLQEYLNTALVEREVEASLAMVALVSRQHLFLLGEPGTGKSLVSRLVGQAVGNSTDCPYFEILLTRFTDPSEVFGPLSVKQLVENEAFVRKTERFLPTARVAFLDEIWKSSSAILNSLLTLVNERAFDNGGTRIDVPLETMFTASNELPQDASLAALYDRFLLRREVTPVSNKALLLDLPPPSPPPKIKYLAEVQKAAAAVSVSKSAKQALFQASEGLASEGIRVGDRRFLSSLSLVRASALLRGREEAIVDDVAVVAHSWWNTPDQIQTTHRIVASSMASAAANASAPSPPKKNAKGGASSAHWMQVVGVIDAHLKDGILDLDPVVDSKSFHDAIHECLISSEATHPSREDQMRKMALVKQLLMTSGRWLGPSW